MLAHGRNEGLDVCQRGVTLHDVGGRAHVAAVAPEDPDLLRHIGLDFGGSAEGQQLLLVDGAPERETLAILRFEGFGIVAGHVGLDRVEDLESDLDQVVQDGGNRAITVVHDEDDGVGALKFLPELGHARFE